MNRGYKWCVFRGSKKMSDWWFAEPPSGYPRIASWFRTWREAYDFALNRATNGESK
jgi:hypothetical protein